ncbi:MAG: DUF2778 domain-containing protein [Gammaproteobacteria bacterium]|nr:DUF2778 domain-containing protein [Gammaproteobacteria bacterium]
MSGNAQAAVNEKYAGERYKPKVPACAESKIELNFNGSRLLMTVKGDKNRYFTYQAVSGRPNQSGKFVYSDERQKKAFEGPIQQADYWINPDEIWENSWYKFWVSDEAWGEFRITIHPYPSTKTHGRGGFFIHGGTVRGSADCIDLTTHISQFIKDLKRELNGRLNSYVPLRVRYH